MLAQDAKGCRHDVIRGEAQVVLNILPGCRRSETVDAYDGALVSRPSMPSDCRGGFHGHALLDFPGKDAFAIGIVLGFEQATNWAC